MSVIGEVPIDAWNSIEWMKFNGFVSSSVVAIHGTPQSLLFYTSKIIIGTEDDL